MRIQHFLKVHSFAHLIGVQEGLEPETLRILDIAAILHDIGIHPAEERYGYHNGKLQEEMGPPCARKILEQLEIEEPVIQRVEFLVGHHHTYAGVDSIDWQILLEADFLVNSFEKSMSIEAICNMKERVFQTASGIMFQVRNELVARKEELAALIATDQGKHIVDARAEMDRAIQLTETCCGLPLIMRGDHIMISTHVEGEVRREALGVVGALAPFNFPALVYGWFVPFAITTGNTLVYKASEQSPMFMQKIAEIFDAVGLPAGVFNLVNGTAPVVNQMLESPVIKAMAFVGSSKVGQIVAEGSARTNKKSMVLAGAKNTLIVEKSVNISGFVKNFQNSCFGAAGQRCMAGANVVVEEAVYDQVKAAMTRVALETSIGDSNDPGVYMGPVVSRASVERIHGFIERALQEGGKLVVDGRQVSSKLSDKNQNGYFVGPTIIENVTKDFEIAQEEVFGPVVSLIKVKNYKEGIEMINTSKYGNGGAIFTESGVVAQNFLIHADSGMIGVNIGVPASMPYLPFGGTKASLMGGQYKAQISDAVEFFTKRKACTVQYFGPEDVDWTKDYISEFNVNETT